MKDKIEEFEQERKERIVGYAKNSSLQNLASQFLEASICPKYSYNFSWLGRPIIQYPQDIVAMQEILWKVQPDLVIETGIAHGGSLIFFSSILELISMCGGMQGEVLGIDIDIRPHNRKAIEAHPMCKRITMIEGSSLDEEVIEQVRQKAQGKKRVVVCLDSDHTYEHVRGELCAYAPLTSVGSYCIVFDTVIEDLPDDFFPDRPWNKENNPKTAVKEFLAHQSNFEIDSEIQNKLLITVAPDGFLRRVR